MEKGESQSVEVDVEHATHQAKDDAKVSVGRFARGLDGGLVPLHVTKQALVLVGAVWEERAVQELEEGPSLGDAGTSGYLTRRVGIERVIDRDGLVRRPIGRVEKGDRGLAEREDGVSQKLCDVELSVVNAGRFQAGRVGKLESRGQRVSPAVIWTSSSSSRRWGDGVVGMGSRHVAPPRNVCSSLHPAPHGHHTVRHRHGQTTGSRHIDSEVTHRSYGQLGVGEDEEEVVVHPPSTESAAVCRPCPLQQTRARPADVLEDGRPLQREESLGRESARPSPLRERG